MSPDTAPIVKSIRRTLRWLLAATVVLYLVVIAVGYISFDKAATANTALCTLRVDLEKRVEAGDKFLTEHPRGFAGISAATLKQSIDGQRRTIRALQTLSC